MSAATPQNRTPPETYVPVGRPRPLTLGAPLRWLRLGWRDLRRAPLASLSYGTLFVLASYLLTLLALTDGNYVVIFSLVTGFMLVGPVLAFALYDVSRQLERGQRPGVAHTLQAMRENLGGELVFALLLGVILLVWMRSAAMVHVFFPTEEEAGLVELVTFFGVGSAVGALFAILVFGISAFSLPMMMDTGADIATAVITSLRVVSAHKGVMALWAGLIVVVTAVGILTAFLGLMVALPLLGYATWHAYRESVEVPPA